MKGLTARHGASLGLLTIAWCSLWGDISLANVLGGLAVAGALLVSGVGTAGQGAIRFIPLLRLAGLVFVDMVKSTINVAQEIVQPTGPSGESIIAVDVPTECRHHVLLLGTAITLTPGTAVVEADPDRSVIYVHLLHDKRRAATVAHVQELAALAVAALPIETRGVE